MTSTLLCIQRTASSYSLLDTTFISVDRCIKENQLICLNYDYNFQQTKHCGDKGKNLIKLPYKLDEGLVKFNIELFEYTFSTELILESYEQQYYIVPSSAESVLEYEVPISRPCFGSILSNEMDIGFTSMTFESAYMEISFDVKALFQFTVLPPNKELKASNIEPASWFYEFTPKVKFSSDNDIEGVTSFGYIEYVLNASQIELERVHSDVWKHTPLPPPAALETTDQSKSPSRICIWGSNKMDGQKMIWLQQVQHLSPADFAFTWILTTNIDDDSANTPYNTLKGLPNVVIQKTPFNENPIPLDSLEEDPLDGSPPVSLFWVR